MSENWQSIIQLILTPTLMVGALAFVMREVFKSYLSMDVERYKSELQSDLESHKARLKAEYDAKQFEYQTRFSLLHQKRADAISQMYSLVSETHNLLLNASIPYRKDGLEFGSKNPKKAIEKYNETMIFFKQNKILFDNNLANLIDKTICAMDDCLVFVIKAEQATLTKIEIAFETTLENRTKAFNISSNLADSVLIELESEFRKLLSAENPNFQLEKKQ